MKILVTGGAGFIGSHVAEKYLKIGHEVVVIDNLSTGLREFVPRGGRFIEADLRDFGTMDRIVSKERAEVVSHHAAQIDVRNSVQRPVHDCLTNVAATVHLYESARRQGLRKFIFASSGGVIYGEPDRIPISEKTSAAPQSPYAAAKLSAEHYLSCFHHLYGISSTVLRYANVYGPRQLGGEAGVISIFFRNMVSGRRPAIYGDGRQRRDFVFIDDVVDANVRALEHEGFGIFNIGTGVATSIRDLYRSVAAITRFAEPPLHEPPRQGELFQNALDVRLASTSLGWRPHTDLKTGLAAAGAWWRGRIRTVRRTPPRSRRRATPARVL